MGRFTGSGTAGVAGLSFPAGSIMLFAGVGATPPVGWFLCDGQEVSRVGFAALFAAIGTLYGVGDGSTTFNVPKFDDNRKARGAVNDAARGTTGGANTVTLTTAQMPVHTHVQDSHTHSYVGIGSVGTGFGGEAGLQTTGLTTGATTAINQDAGSGTAHNNESLFVDVNYIIHV